MRETTLNGLILTLGDVPCGTCRYSAFPGWNVKFRTMPCGKCKGTGKRGNGRCRACTQQYSATNLPVGHVPDYDEPYPDGKCRACAGALHVPATITDSLPEPVLRSVVDTIGVRVHLRQGGLSASEALLGMAPTAWDAEFMALWSSTDGQPWRQLAAAWNDGEGTDAEREARVRAVMDVIAAEIGERIAADRVQACKLFHDDRVMAGAIMVMLSRNGYTVIAASRPAEQRAEILAAAGMVTVA